MKSLDRAHAVEIDRKATEIFGVPSILLMECAALAMTRVALLLTSIDKRDRFVVIAGPGNNGADGVATARHIWNRTGQEIEVVYCGSPEQMASPSDEARRQREMIDRCGAALRTIQSESDVDDLRRRIEPDRTLVIDALFGIGLRRPIQGLDLAVVRALNASHAAVLAVDIPSGLDCDTGEPLGDSVRATTTVTFGQPKKGLLVPSARAFVGRLAVAEIGFPRELLEIPAGVAQPDIRWLDAGE